MKIGPSIFSILSGRKHPRRGIPRIAPTATPTSKGAATGWRPLPTGAYKKKSKLITLVTPYDPLAANCECFKYCDLIYQHKLPAEKLQWARAVKRSCLSPYDLWMSECITLAVDRRHPPDQPSISGGWSNTKCIEGTTHPLAPAWGPYLTNSVVRHCTVEASSEPHRDTWKVTVTCIPPGAHDPPSWGFYRIAQWRLLPAPFWYSRFYNVWNDPPQHWPREDWSTDKFVVQWPAHETFLLCAPFHEPAFWDYQAPNYPPWPVPPLIPPPWPNTPFDTLPH